MYTGININLSEITTDTPLRDNAFELTVTENYMHW